eukprot:1371299-Amorphochlora_amoeboformis.AAC.2
MVTGVASVDSGWRLGREGRAREMGRRDIPADGDARISICALINRPRRKKKGLVERAAVCAFQGRRQSMEDAHVCIPDAREYKTTAFFAVYGKFFILLSTAF